MPRLRVDAHEPDPAAERELRHLGLACGDGEQRLRARFDEAQEPHRLVDLDHLRGQSRAQIARGALHHAEQRGHVVRQLRAGAEALWIDAREVVLEVDARTHGHHGAKDAPEQHELVVVRGVVGDEEGPPVEEEPTRERAPPDDRHRVRRVPELGPGLAEVDRARLHVSERVARIRAQIGVLEAPTALVRGALARAVEGTLELGEALVVRGGHALAIVERHRVVRGVVQPPEEPGALVDLDASLRERGAHPRIVRHVREGARVGPAVRAAAGAAFVGRVVGVVDGARAVTEQRHERGEARDEADVAQERLDAVDLLLEREAQRQARRLVRFVGALEPELGVDAGHQRRREPAQRTRREARRGELQRERQEREEPEQRGHEHTAEEGARAVGQLVGDEREQRASASALLGAGFHARRWLLVDRVTCLHGDRAEIAARGIVERGVAHRHPEEARGAEGLVGRVLLLQVAAEGLLAIVDAEERLQARCPRCGLGLRQASVDRADDLEQVVSLVGLVQHTPAAQAVEVLDGVDERVHGLGAHRDEVGRGVAGELRDLVEAVDRRVGAVEVREQARAAHLVDQLARAALEAHQRHALLHGAAIEREPEDRQLEQGGRRGARAPVFGVMFEPRDHAGPAGQRRVGAQEIAPPVRLCDAEILEQGLEHLRRRGRRREARCEALVRAAQPGLLGERRGLELRDEAPQEATLTVRHRPTRHALVEVGREEAHELRVALGRWVGRAGGDEQITVRAVDPDAREQALAGLLARALGELGAHRPGGLERRAHVLATCPQA